MSIKNVAAGVNPPEDFNVVIEVPALSNPVKYEVDKETGALFVDRFMPTSMHYPCNYGYVPNTLSLDGDPVDVLVVSPFPITSGAVVRCRVLGMLNMTDEAGEDNKILAVPMPKVCPLYQDIQSLDDLPKLLLKQIEHFFEHYKDLESGKWVKVERWHPAEDAKTEILESIQRWHTHTDR